MTTLTRCANLQEALLLKSVLEGSGIAAVIPDELTAQNMPHYFFAGSGLRLQVGDEHAEAARLILRNFAAENE